ETRRLARVIDQKGPEHHRHRLDAVETYGQGNPVVPQPLAELVRNREPETLLDLTVVVRRQYRHGIPEKARVIADDGRRRAGELQFVRQIPRLFRNGVVEGELHPAVEIVAGRVDGI